MGNIAPHFEDLCLRLRQNAIWSVCWIGHDDSFLWLRGLGRHDGEEEEEEGWQDIEDVELHVGLGFDCAVSRRCFVEKATDVTI